MFLENRMTRTTDYDLQYSVVPQLLEDIPKQTSGIRVAGFSLQHGYHSNPTTPKLQHTSNQEQNDQCGNSTEWSQAPDDGYINVRNMLST
jgi:hypothetical protein